ncbi:hypothetical protein [Winogradskyella tangerina]|uniref:hypothetical protein n=1 Tax=Winogradskyella tangerina TaxID=2023240 RepID=UPI000DBE8068|nr:hypothetical protein [Winogradskyella tangerina]
MKKFLALSILFFVVFGHAQEKSIEIDYTVEYLIPKRLSSAVDTVKVGFDKDGKYLWTDSDFLAKDLARSVFEGNDTLLENAELNIVLDTENLTMMLFFNSGKNEMYMNVEISNFFPVQPLGEESKEFELIAEPTGETKTILNKAIEVYEVFPSNDPNDSVNFGFDNTIEVNNAKLFERFFSLIFAAEDKLKLKSIDFPNGLILSISDDGETILEANSIDTKTKTISLIHSFKITE